MVEIVGPGGAQQVHERGRAASGGKDAADIGGGTGKAAKRIMRVRPARAQTKASHNTIVC
jgi:hypothetical protein